MRTLLSVLILYLSIKSDVDAYRRIVGGRDATLDEFPYVAAWGHFYLYNNKRTFSLTCTCSFLLPNWAITASHCIDTNATNLGFVLYGNIVPGQQSNYTKVLQVYRHPNYFDSSEDTGTSKNDIGLLRTNNTQLLSYAILSAVDYTTMIGHEVFLPGYGGTNDTERVADVISLNKTLQVFKGMINTCTAEDSLISNGVCVSSPCEHVAMICGGDSGGPLIHASGIVGVFAGRGVMCDTNRQFRNIHRYSLAKVSSAIAQPVSPVANWLYMVMRSKD